MGFEGRGTRSLKGMAVQLSRAWNKTSNPDEMCTSLEHESVLRGSTIPRRGRIALLAIPVLAERGE